MENNREKLPDGGIDLSSGAGGKLSNFWYYHKWHLLIAVFVVVVLLVCILQGRENNKEDVSILMAGPYKVTQTEQKAMEAALSALLSEDYNGDGEKVVQAVMLTVFSDAQVAEIKAAANAQPAQTTPYSGFFSESYNADQYDSFHNLIAAGEYAVCIIDPWLYESVKANGGFCLLKDVLGEVPENAVDEYGLLFSETALAKSSPEVFGLVPQDSILCLRTVSVMGSIISGGKTEKQYARSMSLFKAMAAAAE